MMAKRLVYHEMVAIVRDILNPSGFTSEQINQKLILFSASCPDPAAAMDVIVETPDPVTAEDLVRKALTFPPRDVSTLPESELAAGHPLRHIKFDA